MKKFILLFFTIALLASCSSMNDQDELVSKKNETTLLLSQLSSLHDSLMQTKQETRGWVKPGYYRRACIIAADISGAWSTGCTGAGIFGYFGPQAAIAGATMGALYGGIMGSYVAYRVSCTTTSSSDLELVPRTLKNNILTNCKTRASLETSEDFSELEGQVIAAYLEVQNEDLDISDYTPEYIKVEYPENTDSLVKQMGAFHNLLLDKLLTEDIHLDTTQTKLPELEAELLQCDEFNECINTTMNGISTAILNDTYYAQPTKDKMGKVMNMFYSLLTQYPENLYDTEFIINKYIELIKDSNELTDEEKKVIYEGLSIAASSSEYWEDKITE